MSKETIAQNQWSDYLEELFRWISEKYQLLESREIDENEYNKHLVYYNEERERIENIMKSDGSPNISIESEKPKSKSSFTQETFEQYFGVKLKGKPEKEQVTNEVIIDKVETSKQIKKTPIRKPTTPVYTSESTVDQIKPKETWEYVETSKTKDFKVSGNNLEITRLTTLQANILLIGDSAVGRTSLRRAWMGKHFIENHLTTIGASIEKKSIDLDGIKYNITLTDLGGQDFYSGLRKNFYRNIDGAIVVFDLTKKESFLRIDFWINELFREVKRLVPFILVGNKSDSKNRIISKKAALEIVEKYSKKTLPKFKIRYLETSAKQGKNVNEIFDTMCREIKSFKVQKQRRG